MITRNLRHLRFFLTVTETGSVSVAAARCNVSQPAVTQAINKLEKEHGAAFFRRTRQGLFVTERGRVLADRVRRAFALLDPALTDLSPRLNVTATTAQLNALIAVRETENFTLAARKLGLAQPTVHRAISQLEREAGRALFERASFGLLATRQATALAQAARLAYGELDQAEAELAELDGGEAGRLVVGALPLSRTVVLPQALSAYRQRRPTQPITIVEGTYSELLGGLRRGEIDVIVGALRDPAPIGDIVQEALFDDHLWILCGNAHSLAGKSGLKLDDLRDYCWILPRRDTPARDQFDAYFADSQPPGSIIEAGSILLMREMLWSSDFLGCISGSQAAAEVSKELLTRLDVRAEWPGRPIGLTYRQSWAPTGAQALLLDLIRQAAAETTGTGSH